MSQIKIVMSRGAGVSPACHQITAGETPAPLSQDADGVPLPTLPDAGVKPPGDVDRLQFVGDGSPIEFAEALKEVLVPDVCGTLVVLLGVRQEQVSDLGDEDLIGLWKVGRVG